MKDPLTVRVRAKGDGLLPARDAFGRTIPGRYVGRGSDGLPLCDGELVAAIVEGDGELVPAGPMLRRALDDGDLEVVRAEPAPAPALVTPSAEPSSPAAPELEPGPAPLALPEPAETPNEDPEPPQES